MEVSANSQERRRLRRVRHLAHISKHDLLAPIFCNTTRHQALSWRRVYPYSSTQSGHTLASCRKARFSDLSTRKDPDFVASALPLPPPQPT